MRVPVLRTSTAVLALLLAAGCPGPTPDPTPDRDGDGYPDAVDVFPDDATEWSDLDEDGVGDNADAFPTDPHESADSDGDGVGDAADCADDDHAVYPGADEVPYNGVDDDCEPQTPDDDLDGDGAPLSDDCDDSDASVGPDEDEVYYNGVDDDCDETTADLDQDGDGDPVPTDCADTDPDRSSTVSEVPYNDVDDDCDPGTLDDDADGDGVLADQATGGGPDCDDTDPDIHPGADETDDGVDEDCDGDALERDLFDADGDGYTLGYGALDDPTPDCDDTLNWRFPGALEYCDTYDSDCDGSLVDEFDDTDGDEDPDCTDPDIDGDGFDNLTELHGSCGEVTSPYDAQSKPLDTDGDGTCDGLDSDDDGDGWSDTAESTQCDTDPLDAQDVPVDTDDDKKCDLVDPDDDNDGWTDLQEADCLTDPLDDADVPVDADSDCACEALDCDDDDIYNYVSCETCADLDGDGAYANCDYYGPNSCGSVGEQRVYDCNDDESDTFVGAAEIESPYGCMRDADDDGWGDQTAPEGASAGTDCDDADVDNWTACATCQDGDEDGAWTGCDAYTLHPEDCDDGDGNVKPGAADTTADLVDDNCDGRFGDAASGDADGDLFAAQGTDGSTVDCDDTNPLVNPGIGELPDDGLDNDCGGDGDLVLDESTGIFVVNRFGLEVPCDDGNPGTRAEPFCTMQDALDAAAQAGKVVFASDGATCVGVCTSTVSIHGGYDTDTWTRSGWPLYTGFLGSTSLGLILSGEGLTVSGIRASVEYDFDASLTTGILVEGSAAIVDSEVTSRRVGRGVEAGPYTLVVDARLEGGDTDGSAIRTAEGDRAVVLRSTLAAGSAAGAAAEANAGTLLVGSSLLDAEAGTGLQVDYADDRPWMQVALAGSHVVRARYGVITDGPVTLVDDLVLGHPQVSDVYPLLVYPGAHVTLLGNDLWGAYSGGMAAFVLRYPDIEEITTLEAVEACDWLECVAASDNLSADPLLVNPNNLEWQPTASSPLVDAGIDPTPWLALPADHDGDPRPAGATWDIGAWEQ